MRGGSIATGDVGDDLAVGEAAGGLVAHEVLPVRRVVGLEHRAGEVVVVADVDGGVAERDDRRHNRLRLRAAAAHYRRRRYKEGHDRQRRRCHGHRRHVLSTVYARLFHVAPCRAVADALATYLYVIVAVRTWCNDASASMELAVVCVCARDLRRQGPGPASSSKLYRRDFLLIMHAVNAWFPCTNTLVARYGH